jgi:hypothetical protein
LAKSIIQKQRDAARLEAAKTARDISPVQRITIEALLHSVTKGAAIERLKAEGFDVSLAIVNKWLKRPYFIEALQARTRYLAQQLSKDSVLINAKNIMEAALEGKPIVGEDKDGKAEIIGYERQFGPALVANEQIGKALGAFNKDESGKTIVVIDIDFSGRKNVVQETVIGGDFIEGEFRAAPDKKPQPPTDATIEKMQALDELVLEAKPSWLD